MITMVMSHTESWDERWHTQVDTTTAAFNSGSHLNYSYIIFSAIYKKEERKVLIKIMQH